MIHISHHLNTDKSFNPTDISNLQHRRLAGKMMEVENNVAEHFDGELNVGWKYMALVISQSRARRIFRNFKRHFWLIKTVIGHYDRNPRDRWLRCKRRLRRLTRRTEPVKGQQCPCWRGRGGWPTGIVDCYTFTSSIGKIIFEHAGRRWSGERNKTAQWKNHQKGWKSWENCWAQS